MTAEPTKTRLQIVRRIIAWLVISALLIVITKYGYDHRADFVTTFTEMRAHWVPPLLAVLAVVNLVTSTLWALLVRAMGCELSLGRLVAIWHQSLLGKYVPGSIWMHLGRIYQLRRSGVSLRVGAYSAALEQLVVLASGLLIVLLTPDLLIQLHLPPWIGLLLAPFVLVIVAPNLLGEMAWWIGVRRIDLRMENSPSLLFMVFYLGGHVVRSLLGGFSILLILYVFNSDAAGLGIVHLASIGAVSFVIGYLSLLTPGGIGVKEGLLILLLSQHVPTSVAVLVAVSGRLWSLFTDGFGSGLGSLYLWIAPTAERADSALAPTEQS